MADIAEVPLLFLKVTMWEGSIDSARDMEVLSERWNPQLLIFRSKTSQRPIGGCVAELRPFSPEVLIVSLLSHCLHQKGKVSRFLATNMCAHGGCAGVTRVITRQKLGRA